MADLKITQLPSVTTLDPADVFPVVDAGLTKQVSVVNLNNSLPITTFVRSTSSLWGGGTGTDISTITNYLSTNSVQISALTVRETLSAKAIGSENITVTNTFDTRVRITNLTTSKTFLNTDTCNVFHFDTTTQTLSAIFPFSLPNGFNVAIMNTGTNNLILSASQLNSIGTIIGATYGGAFVYKDNNQLFAVGRL